MELNFQRVNWLKMGMAKIPIHRLAKAEKCLGKQALDCKVVTLTIGIMLQVGYLYKGSYCGVCILQWQCKSV